MNMSVVIYKVNYGAISDDNISSQCYYIIIFSPSPYIFQEDLNIDAQVICYGGNLREVNY